MLSSQQQGSDAGLDLADTQLLLKWMDALARYPTGADDVTPVPGVLPPVQKLVLQILGQFTGVSVMWQHMSGLVAGKDWCTSPGRRPWVTARLGFRLLYES